MFHHPSGQGAMSFPHLFGQISSPDRVYLGVTNEDHIELYMRAWFELGVSRGHYLEDVRYENLSQDEKSKLRAAAKDAINNTTLTPYRRPDDRQWVFIER